jgi:hypothetical protein
MATRPAMPCHARYLVDEDHWQDSFVTIPRSDP